MTPRGSDAVKTAQVRVQPPLVSPQDGKLSNPR